MVFSFMAKILFPADNGRRRAGVPSPPINPRLDGRGVHHRQVAAARRAVDDAEDLILAIVPDHRDVGQTRRFAAERLADQRVGQSLLAHAQHHLAAAHVDLDVGVRQHRVDQGARGGLDDGRGGGGRRTALAGAARRVGVNGHRVSPVGPGRCAAGAARAM
jgi:hypothetical protein